MDTMDSMDGMDPEGEALHLMRAACWRTVRPCSGLLPPYSSLLSPLARLLFSSSPLLLLSSPQLLLRQHPEALPPQDLPREGVIVDRERHGALDLR